MKMKRLLALLLSLSLIMSNSSMIVFAETASESNDANIVVASDANGEEAVIEEITAGETKMVTIVSNRVTYLRFTPEVSGIYEFKGLAGSDTYGYLYDSNMNEITYDDDGAGNLQFRISHELQAGVTYYWGARYYHQGDSGSFRVQLTCTEAYCAHENVTEVAATEATCYTYGYTAGTKCNDCGQWASGHERVEVAHVDEGEDNLCDRCRKEMPVSSGTCGGYYVYGHEDAEGHYDGSAKYYKYADGTLEIYGEGIVGDSGELEEGLFAVNEGSDSIKKVIVREGITAISYRIFYGCDALETVTLAESVGSIGSYAFYGCNNLKDITILNPTCTIYDQDAAISYTATIIGHKGSSAETYAQEYGRNFLEYCPHENTTAVGEVGATCYTYGYTAGEKCNDCGRWAFGHERLEVSHNDENGDNSCDRCGKGMPASSDTCGGYYIYEYYDGSAKYYKYADGTLEIYGEGTIASSDGGRFEYDPSIEKVIISEGITEIGSWTFDECDNLSEAILPDSIKTIRTGAFSGCESLEKITLSKSVTAIEDSAFYGGTVIWCYKDSVAASYAETNNQPYVLLDGGDDVNIITGTAGPNFTWTVNKKMETLELKGSGALPSFSNSSAPWAEYGPYITKLVLPSGLTAIREGAFSDLYGLEDVYVPSVEDWLAIDMPDYDYSAHPMHHADNLYFGNTLAVNVVIPEGVKAIQDDAFANVDTLETVSLPTSLERLGEAAFVSCDKLAKIEIPYNVRYIEYGCFENCSNLTEIVFALDDHNDSAIRGIDSYAFSGCPLTEIVFPASVEYIYSGVVEPEIKHITVYNPNCGISESWGASYNTMLYGFKGSTTEQFANNNSLYFTDVETVHSHDYKEFASIGYCKRGRCTCGKEEKTVHVDTDKNIVCDVCNKTTNDLEIDQTVTVPMEDDEFVYLSYTPTQDGLYEFEVKAKDAETHMEVYLYDEEKEYMDDSYSSEGLLTVSRTLINQERVYLAVKSNSSEVDVTLQLKEVHEHDYTSEVTKEPTCTLKGQRVYVCECGASYTDDVPKLGHNYSKSFTVDKKATLTNKGSKSKHCTRDGCVAKIGTTDIYAASNVKLSFSSVTYNGKVKSPVVTIKDSEGNTISSANYKLTTPTGRKNAGTYTYTVKFKNEYSGTKTMKLTINKATMTGIKAKGKTVTYNGKAHTITLSGLPKGAKVTYKTSAKGAYKATKPTRTNAGTTTVYYKVTKANYKVVTGSVKIVVNKRAIANATLTKTEFVYSGKANKPAVTVKNSSGAKLKKGTDYTVAYKNNTKVGKATVTVTGKGNYKGTLTKNFTINPKATSISGVTAAKNAFTVKWKKVAKETTGYEIMYATNQKFTKGNKIVPIQKSGTISKKITGLKSKQTYYVKVRTYKKVNGKNYYSAWSGVKNVKVK